MNDLQQKTEIKKSFKDKILGNINIMRADSGLNRLLISLSFVVLSFFLIYFGYKLIIMGAKGEFIIFSEYKGFKLTFWSLSPGLFFGFGGVAILIWALPRTLKAFFDFSRSKD
jgi:ABC-type antimicrobial peptide transport system permease subunit